MFLRTVNLIVSLLLLFHFSYAQRPNIVLIIADDVSQDDIGCYGNTAIRTPNLDRIAKEGLTFTNAFVTSSSCSPSRSSIITGRYPHNTGAAELHTPLPPHLTYFPELLKKAGYYTAQAGKWHEGPHTKRAYDTLMAGDINGDGGEEQWLTLLKNRPKEKPFFFWFAPYDAHREWQEDKRNTSHETSKVIVPPALTDNEETRADLVAYYNEISRLDSYVGLLEKELQDQKIAENTIIIFMSDNGRPFAGSKTRLYDSGVKTPFIVKWPKGITQPGAQCQSLISSIDIAPTILSLAGVPLSPTIQGKSFAKLLRSPGTAFRNYVFTEHNWHDYEAYERAVRTTKLLYIINLRPDFANQGPLDAVNSPSFKALLKARSNGLLTSLQKDVFLNPRPPEELFHVIEDPLQQTNLIAEIATTEYKGDLDKLRQILKQWQDETGDTRPVNLTKDWYGRENGETLPGKDKRGEMPGASAGADRIDRKGPF
ncbi:MAG TPA: sulfatase [Cyclobacteriaceae bacterium]|nr:sulfatase [Cyclobacteriaceae bacterium]